MANISNAFGKCNFKTYNMETMKALFRAFKTLEGASYDTYTDSEINELMIIGTKDGLVTTVDFSGSGRWSYDNNIKCFGSWTKDKLSDADLKILTENYWSMYYDFRDEEGGCGFVYEEEIELIHAPETAYENTTCLEHRYKEYERTAINFISLRFYEDLNDFIECEILGSYDFDDEDDCECALEKLGDIDELVDYYNCKDVNELKERFGLLNELI